MKISTHEPWEDTDISLSHWVKKGQAASALFAGIPTRHPDPPRKRPPHSEDARAPRRGSLEAPSSPASSHPSQNARCAPRSVQLVPAPRPAESSQARLQTSWSGNNPPCGTPSEFWAHGIWQPHGRWQFEATSLRMAYDTAVDDWNSSRVGIKGIWLWSIRRKRKRKLKTVF